MYLPWNRSWGYYPGNFRLLNIDLNEHIRDFQTMVHSTAAVTLMPSPGERFWLKVDCVNGALADIDMDISIDVRLR